MAGWRERFPGHRPLGIYNAYVPVELFYAAGLTPVYLFHRAEDRGHARAHLPPFACWPGRSLVDQALAGDLDGLAGLALGQTCDTVQALVDVGRVILPGVPVYPVGVPHHLATPAARPYLLRELQQLRGALGNPPDGALRQAIAAYNALRREVRALYGRAADLPPTDLYAILRALHVAPPEAAQAWLQALLQDGVPAQAARGPRLLLVGPHLADPALYQVIEESGARVAGDLLDVGSRYFAGQVAPEGDPLEALADHTLALLPTPTKHHPGRRRDEALVAEVRRQGADGVVFARQKFCDPHGFDYVPLKAALTEAGIPQLYLELEQAPHLGQLRTRVQAFVEMVSTDEHG